MLTLDLPRLDDTRPPAFSDPQGCKNWLKALPLTNVQAAQAELFTQIALLNRHSLPALERLKIAELLREPAAFLVGELSKRYAGKPVPMDEEGLSAWHAGCRLWESMGETYQRCLQACLDGDTTVADYAHIIVQRCLRYQALLLLEHYRAYREVEPRLWQRLHTLYAYAEHRGYGEKSVRDSLNQMEVPSSCRAVYVQALLTFLANPYQLSARQLNLLDKWLDKWGGRVPIVDSPPAADELRLPAVVVEWPGGGPPQIMPEGVPANSRRYLDTARLAGALRKRVKFLRKGGSPAELDLGEECVQPGCEIFLTTLYQHWCEEPAKRTLGRREEAGEVTVCLGLPAMHFFIGGEVPLAQPGEEKPSLSWQELENLQIFGHVADRKTKPTAASLGYATESWTGEDESALDFCLVRRGAGVPLSRGQAVGVRPAGAPNFIAGSVRWLRQGPDGSVTMEVRVFPGLPVAVGAAQVGLNQGPAPKFVPALALPPIPTLHAQGQLILPAGWFRAGRLVTILQDGRQQTFKLIGLQDKGLDFERVAVNAV